MEKIPLDELHSWVIPTGKNRGIEPNCTEDEFISRNMTERLGFAFDQLNDVWVKDNEKVYPEKFRNIGDFIQWIRVNISR